MNHLDDQVYTKEERARDKANYVPVKYTGNVNTYVFETDLMPETEVEEKDSVDVVDQFSKPKIKLRKIILAYMVIAFVLVWGLREFQSSFEETPEEIKSLAQDGLILNDIGTPNWIFYMVPVLLIFFVMVSVVLAFVYNLNFEGVKFYRYVVTVMLLTTIFSLAAYMLPPSNNNESFNTWAHSRYGVTLGDNRFPHVKNSNSSFALGDGKDIEYLLRDDKENIVYYVIDRKDKNRIFLYNPVTKKELATLAEVNNKKDGLDVGK